MIEGGAPVLPADAPDALEAAIQVLWAGGIVGLPTETVYGLAVIPQPEPLASLLLAKRRPAEKGIALLVESMDQVEPLAEIGPAARRLAARWWPGPLTLVLSPRPGVDLPEPLYGASGTLAFRVPDHPVPRALAATLGPLALTSANVSGEPDATTAAQLVAAIGHSISLVLDGGSTPGGVPSTVVAFDPEGARVLREGALPAAEVLAALD